MNKHLVNCVYCQITKELTEMILYIKNMVCNRCKLVVGQILQEQNIPYSQIHLGEVNTRNTLDIPQQNKLNERLQAFGFELLNDKQEQLVEKVKTAIIELLHTYPDYLQNQKFSVWLSDKIGKDFKQISTQFSDSEGITLEQYLIIQKIERIKELLVYNELNISQIADLLAYSSVQYLSNQFKKITGLTPSQFKNTKQAYAIRKPLDKVGEIPLAK